MTWGAMKPRAGVRGIALNWGDADKWFEVRWSELKPRFVMPGLGVL